MPFADQGGRIVYVKVNIHSTNQAQCDNSDNNPMELPGMNSNIDIDIPYYYSIKYKENNNIKWAARWDYMLHTMPTPRIQWFSILNSLVIVLFLSGMVAMILLRTIHKDLAKYNNAQNGVS